MRSSRAATPSCSIPVCEPMSAVMRLAGSMPGTINAGRFKNG
jgi:hypothetical protein